MKNKLDSLFDRLLKQILFLILILSPILAYGLYQRAMKDEAILKTVCEPYRISPYKSIHDKYYEKDVGETLKQSERACWQYLGF